MKLLGTLSDAAIRHLAHDFSFWAEPHQLPPEGTWRAWVILGGRGAGKTRAGAEWVRAQVSAGHARRIALLGETYDEVREVMVFGDSGIMAVSPSASRPKWEASRRMLVWPCGARAQCFSAHDPEGLRGPQFDLAWCDELGKWPNASATWDMLQFGLRLGQSPRVLVTTTPRNQPCLKSILANPMSVSTHAPTEANRAFLAPGFIEALRAQYGGTRLARQELDGVLTEDAEGSLWPRTLIEAAHVRDTPQLNRIVVAVDPAVSGRKGADLCGIIVAGVVAQGPPQNWRAYVLADRSIKATSPSRWAHAAIAAREKFGAARIVAEVNQGGDLVQEVLRQIDPLVPYTAVFAAKGKVARAEPVAALYEQGRVHHLPGLEDLEDQMAQMTAHGFDGQGSPDRVDALVWALNALILTPAARFRIPGMRGL